MAETGSLRERLVDIGVELVMTEGSASVGLREIARRAGVSHGAPRRYFPTHQALLSAIALRGFEDLGARFQSAIAGSPTPRSQMRAVALAYVGYAMEHRGMFELMFRHDLLDGGQQASGLPRLRESTLPAFGRFAELVRRCREDRTTGQHAGAPTGSAASPNLTAAVLWSNLHGIAQLWASGSLRLVLGAASDDGTPATDASGNDALTAHASDDALPADASDGNAPATNTSADHRLDQLITAALDAHLGPAAS